MGTPKPYRDTTDYCRFIHNAHRRSNRMTVRFGCQSVRKCLLQIDLVLGHPKHKEQAFSYPLPDGVGHAVARPSPSPISALLLRRPGIIFSSSILARTSSKDALLANAAEVNGAWLASFAVPPYSSDLTTSDFHLVRSLQNSLNGQTFNSEEDAIIHLFLSVKTGNSLSLQIMNLPMRWKKSRSSIHQEVILDPTVLILLLAPPKPEARIEISCPYYSPPAKEKLAQMRAVLARAEGDGEGPGAVAGKKLAPVETRNLTGSGDVGEEDGREEKNTDGTIDGDPEGGEDAGHNPPRTGGSEGRAEQEARIPHSQIELNAGNERCGVGGEAPASCKTTRSSGRKKRTRRVSAPSAEIPNSAASEGTEKKGSTRRAERARNSERRTQTGGGAADHGRTSRKRKRSPDSGSPPRPARPPPRMNPEARSSLKHTFRSGRLWITARTNNTLDLKWKFDKKRRVPYPEYSRIKTLTLTSLQNLLYERMRNRERSRLHRSTPNQFPEEEEPITGKYIPETPERPWPEDDSSGSDTSEDSDLEEDGEATDND
ncbi:hypothetical protein AAG570_007858 [Ranatra chinensis]|uniref:Uncharacterized protein n=1 Tax=Ranatra chinensis TaxID=642074 RepID=A0ABD0XV12_9HEMI